MPQDRSNPVLDAMDELIKSQTAKSQSVSPYIPITTVDSKGNPVYSVFDRSTGRIVPTGQEHGYAPRPDPITGLTLPSAQVSKRGQEQLEGKTPSTTMGTSATPQPPVQTGMLPIGKPATLPQPSPVPSAVPAVTPSPIPEATPAQEPDFTPIQRKAIEGRVQHINQDQSYKDARAVVQQADALLTKVELSKKNPVSTAQIGAEVAKLYEGGRLTDEDVVRYTRDPSMAGRVRDAIYKSAQGVMSPETAHYLKIALEARRMVNQDIVNNTVKEHSQQLSQLYGGSPDRYYKVLMAPSFAKKVQKSQTPEAKEMRETLEEPVESTSDKMKRWLKGKWRSSAPKEGGDSLQEKAKQLLQQRRKK